MRVDGSLVAIACAPAAHAASPPSGWDGENPFDCVLQNAGFGTTVANPEADPFCVEYDKTHQNTTELGVVEFLSKEPARVALTNEKCFYFQHDHWRGSVVQEDGRTETYRWDGSHFYDRSSGDGGVYVENFTFNGKTQDPRAARLSRVPQALLRAGQGRHPHRELGARGSALRGEGESRRSAPAVEPPGTAAGTTAAGWRGASAR